MPTTIKYIGTADNYAELAITGKQSVWQVGQQEERTDAEAALLLSTGMFSTPSKPVTATTNLTGGSDFLSEVSTLKLPAGVTDLTSGGGGGAGIQPDATGALAGRSAYNAEAVGFVYLATDQTPAQYFFREGAAGNWSAAVEVQGPTGASGSVGPLTTQGVHVPRPILVFVDDDGKSATYSVTRELFNAKGKPFCAAVSTSLLNTPGYMTTANLLTLQGEGHEITSHLVSHVSAVIADLGDLGASQAWLVAQGITCKNLTWVGGAYNDATITEAKKFYTSAVSVERGRNVSPVDQFRLRRYAVGAMFGYVSADSIMEDGSQTQYNAMVDMAKNNNCLVIAMMHSWDAAFDSTQQGRVSTMIDYADAQGVQIMTLSQALVYFGNAIDIGTTASKYFRVGADGTVKGDEFDRLAYRNQGFNPAGINNTTLGTGFALGKVSVATFSLASSSGFPISNAGTLQTYYLNNGDTIRQFWYPYNNPTVWKRYGTAGGAGWSTWQSDIAEKTATVSISLGAQTIAAGASVDAVLTHPDPTAITGNSDVILASPVGGLEAGLMFNVHLWTNGTIILRIRNTSAGSITTVVRNWRVKVLA